MVNPLLEVQAALAELDGRRLEFVPREPDENGLVKSLMRHDVPRKPQLKKDPGLRFPKHGTPLTGDEIPEVLKGVI